MASTKKNLLIASTLRQAAGKQNKAIRRSGLLPAVLYGHGVKNINLSLDYKAFETIYRQVGQSGLIDLQLEGQAQPVKVLIQDIQRNPLTEHIIHADLHQVKMTEKIHTEVVLSFIGESKAVKENGGILVKNLSAIKVECLPQDLVQEITVDISSLHTFEDMIRISDLPLPTGMTALESPEAVVTSVQPPRSEEELKELEEKPEEKVAEVEVEGKAKPEEEVPEEGATPAAEPASTPEKPKK